MKWKYKVGDKVKIIKRNYEKESVAVGWVSEMDDYTSIFTIIESTIGIKLQDPVYRIKKYGSDCYDFVVHEWQITPYKNKNKMKI